MSHNFKIITVCTGNICRSPLAQQLLELELQGVEHIELDSAGVQALVEHSMPEFSLKIARQNGATSPEYHKAKQISESLLNGADLILAMDRGHRKSLVQLSPRASLRVFTVLDFARLVDATTIADLREEVSLAGDSVPAKLKAAVEAARLSRSELVPLENPADEDIVDPYGKNESVYEASAEQLLPAVRLVASYLKSALEI